MTEARAAPIAVDAAASGAATAPGAAPGWRAVFAALIAVGAALRLWQYFGDASLWVDEIALARNVLESPAAAILTRPLRYGQSAPPGLLLLLKGMAAVFGDGDRVLRFIPLAGGIATLPLTLAVARRVMPPIGAAIALALVAVSPSLVLRSAEVKQYSTDAAITLVLLLVALRWLEHPTRGRTAALSLVVGLGAWMSQTAVLSGAGVVAALGAAVLLERAPRRTVVRLLAAAVPAAVLALAAALHARSLMTDDVLRYMHDFWRDGFPSLVPRRTLTWLGNEFTGPLATQLGVGRPKRIYALLMAAGWVVVWRRRPGAALLIAAPVLTTLAAALARQYPWADRLVAFLVPCFALAVAAGAALACERLGRIHPAAAALLAALVVAPAVGGLADKPPVVRRHEARPALEYLASHRRPGEPVYVYYAGWQSALYYGPRVGLAGDGVFIGHCALGDLAGYERDLARFAGAPRLWLFVTHERGDDRSLILGFLDTVGRPTDSLVVPASPRTDRPSASVYSWDLRRAGPWPDPPPSSLAADACPPGPELPVDSLLAGWSRP